MEEDLLLVEQEDLVAVEGEKIIPTQHPLLGQLILVVVEVVDTVLDHTQLVVKMGVMELLLFAINYHKQD